MTPQEQFIQCLRLSADKQLLKKAVFSKPVDDSVEKMTVSLRLIGEKLCFQAETFTTDNKAHHFNFSLTDDAPLKGYLTLFRQINLLTEAGDAEYKTSKSGNSVFIGGDALAKKMQNYRGEKATVFENNHEKQYILHGDEPFLKCLGVSDEKGRIHDKKQSKFRQINRFLELVRDCISHLPTEGILRICDLCCGKSYLSFALYHYFTQVLHRDVVMTGVDLKADVVAECNQVAQKLHWDGLNFLCMDVAKYETDTPVHMVVSLHACDFATDLVLQKAEEWQANVILSTPCCHHEMNHTLRPDALPFINAHSMLRQKFCDSATDGLRLLRMQANGYAVQTLELIDPEETPKNVMLRGLLRDGFDKSGAEAEKYWEIYRTQKYALVGDAEVHF